MSDIDHPSGRELSDPSPPACADPRIARALRFIESNLDRPLSLAEVAAVAAVERKYFSRLFRRATGWRFAAWLEHCRLTKARRLLAQTGTAIIEVAAVVGYRDLRTFQRAFKRACGLTPREYRAAQRLMASRLVMTDEAVAFDPSRGTPPRQTRHTPRTRR